MSLRALIGVPFGRRAGGAESMLTALLRRRAEAGIEPLLWFGEDGPYRREVEALGVEAVVAGGPRAAIPRVCSLVRDREPDVLVSWLPRAHLVTGPVAALTGRRARSVCLQHIVADGNWRHVVGYAMPTAAVIATSATSAAGQRRLRPRRPVGVVRPGVEEPAGGERADLGALGLDPSRPTAVLVGRLVAWKGAERLLDAVLEVRAGGVPLQLVVVGGEDRNEADGTEERLQARAAGLEGIALTGQVEDALPYVRAADVLVNASDPEPFGISVVEAMALRVPVLAVANGGPLEIVEDGVSGVLVPTGAAAHLAEGLRRVLADPSRTVTAARQAYEDRFTAARMAAAMGAALTAVADGRFEDGCEF